MPTRREVLGQTAAAGLALAVSARPGLAQDRYDQAALLDFQALGDITLLHYSDLRGMVLPHYLRPVAVRYGPDRVPNLTGEALRIRYGIGGRTHMDAAMTAEGFDALGAEYGPMGGLAQIATAIGAIRKARPGTIVLDGGGSDTPLTGQVLAPDAETVDRTVLVPPPNALAANMHGQPDHATFTRAGAQVAVLGLADPHRTGSGFSLGALQGAVSARRAAGASVVVVLSQMGFEADRSLAAAVEGVDVILSGRSGHVLPEPESVGGTQIIASAAQGRFVSRVDIAVKDGRMAGLRQGLIPVFSRLIRADAAAAQALGTPEAQTVGTAADMLHHQECFSGTWEALIGDAMLAETGAEVALIPPLRGAETVLPGQAILTRHLAQVSDDRRVVKRSLTGAAIVILLEAAAQAVFAEDPIARLETRMMRAAGLSFAIAPQAPEGARISEVSLLATGLPLDPVAEVTVALLQKGEGAALVDVLARHISRRGQVTATPAPVTVQG